MYCAKFSHCEIGLSLFNSHQQSVFLFWNKIGYRKLPDRSTDPCPEHNREQIRHASGPVHYYIESVTSIHIDKHKICLTIGLKQEVDLHCNLKVMNCLSVVFCVS